MNSSDKLLDMNALWVGNNPGPLQLLCLLSAARAGHHVRLFGYRRFGNVPSCIEQVDAREVLHESTMVLHHRTGKPTLFSDRFRYAMIRAGFGAWMDADMLFLGPVATGNGNLFGWEDGTDREIAIGILAYDPASGLAEELCEWSMRDQMIPPWLKMRQRLWHGLRDRLGKPLPHVGDLPFTVLGPDLFTWLVHKHRLTDQVSPWQRFYAIPYGEKARPFKRDGNAETYLTPDTEAVHLWYQGLQGGPNMDNGFDKLEIFFEEGSLVWRIAKEVGLATSAAWRV